MNTSFIILSSALIQFAAALLAFRMTRISRHLAGWTLISVAMLLMGIRRVTTLFGYGSQGLGESLRGLGAETIALSISMLMLGGVLLLRQYFIRQQRQEQRLVESEQKYKELSDQLESRVNQRTRDLLGAIENLQECSRTQSDFLSKMSHELRTPLNAVIGFSDILLSGMDGELAPDQKNDVQLIFNSAQHLLQLINDILDISKLEEGKISLQPEFIPVNQIIDDTLSDYRKQIEEKSLALRQEVPAGLPPVYADSRRMKQILSNLIGNAIKFTEKGMIVIDAGWSDREGHPLTPAPGSHSEFVKISIQDTGIGISDQELSLIFSRFHQTDTGLSRKYEGTGLGLAITLSLVELHGGTIGAESQPDKGSRFWFTLPITEDGAHAAGKAQGRNL